MFKLFITLLLVILLSPNQMVFAENIAEDSNISVEFESVNPGSPYYIFKRIKETFTLNLLTFGEQNKAKYSEQLLDTRLRELAYMVKKGQTGILDNGAHRYTNQAGIIIEKYLKIDQNFKSQAQKYIPILSRLRDYYPSNTPQWLMIQESVDTTKRIAGY